MRIRQVLIGAVVLCATTAGAARAQQVGDEIVLTAGMFVKDFFDPIPEAGGDAGSAMQNGALKFPHDRDTFVGITTLLPASWVGHEIDVVFGGAAGGWLTEDFRIFGAVEGTSFHVTATLHEEDGGSYEETLLSGYEVPTRRFGMSLGRDADHPDDTNQLFMNFEYIALRIVD
jgi:hypothetical protein